MASVDVIQEFRNDHRFVVRSLLALQKALRQRNASEARRIGEELDRAVGPHFQWEEAELYRRLQVFLGEKRIKEMLSYHDGAIGIVANLLDTLKSQALTDAVVEKVTEDLTAFFVHASDCDGLALLAEQLSPGELATLGDQMVKFRREGKSLLEWAKTKRN